MINRLAGSSFVNVFLFSFFWALNILFTRSGMLAGAKPVSFALQSALIALGFLTLISWKKVFPEIIKLPKKLLGIILVINAIHYGFGGFFQAAGLALTSAVNVGFLGKLATLFTIIFAYFLLGEAVNLAKGLVVFSLLMGSFLISTKGQLIVPNPGDILIVLAAVSWAFANVLVRKYLSRTNVSSQLITWLRPVAGIPTLLLFVSLVNFYPESIQAVFKVSLLDWTQIDYVFLSGISAGLLWTFLNRTLKIATASYMTMMSMMTPVMTTVLAVAFLHEPIIAVQVVGGVIIIVSGLITYRLRV